MSKFIGQLQKIVINNDRRALAACRSGEPFQISQFIPDFIADDERETNNKLIIAKLVGLYPVWTQYETDFGKSARQLKNKLTPPDHPEADPHKIERRFMALIDADGEDLHRHLEDFVNLFKIHDVRADWAQLFENLQNWESDERAVQRKWSKSFWSTVSKTMSELGSRTSEAKKKSSAENGKKGGRPKKKENT